MNSVALFCSFVRLLNSCRRVRKRKNECYCSKCVLTMACAIHLSAQKLVDDLVDKIETQDQAEREALRL